MRARPRRLLRGSRRGLLRDGTFSRLCLLWAAVHPIRRHCTPSDRVHRDVTGVARRNGCSASCTAFVKQARSVTERNCPQLCLLWGVVHPIRRHYTPSDRVQCDGSGVARRNGCSATERVQRYIASAVRTASSAHRTRVREPELRASTAQRGFAVGKQTEEGPKPCGSDPSLCRISAVISPRERYDDRRVHPLRNAPNDGSAMRQP